MGLKPSYPRVQEAMMYAPYKKIHNLNKLCSGMNFSPVGYEFNSESTLLLNKVSLNKYTENEVMYGSVDENVSSISQ